MKKTIPSLLALGALLLAGPAHAQGTKVGVVTTLEGAVSARRTALPDAVALRFKDDVFLQDTVVTGEKSLARMLLGGKAVVTVRERSTLTITEVPGRSTIDLETGKFALSVAREKMRPGEEILIRTPNAVAAVRGTVVITEVNRQTAQLGGRGPAAVTSFFVLRGTVTAQPLDPATRQPMGTPLQVGALQAYSGAGAATPRVAPIPPEQVGQITAGLQPTGPKNGGDPGKEQAKAQALGATLQLLGAITGAVVDPTPVLAAAGLLAPLTSSPQGAPLIPPVNDALRTLNSPIPAVKEETPTPPPAALPAPPPPASTAAPSPPPPVAAGPPDEPEILVTGAIALGAGETLATFDGVKERTLTSPLISVTGGGSVTKSAADGVIQVRSGGALSLASPLLGVTGGATVTTTNATLHSVRATVSAGADPIAVALTPDGTRLYVANAEGGTVSVFNAATNTLITTVMVGDSPRGIAVTPDGTKVYVTRQGAISIISTATNTVTGSVSGSHLGGFAAVQGIAITPDGTKGYVALSDEGSYLLVFSTATNTITAEVTGSFSSVQRLVASPDGTRVYASEQGGGNRVLVISTATNSIVATISVGTSPFGLAISNDGTRLYVANQSSGTVSVINTGNDSVERTISVGSSPRGIALTPDGTRLLVTNSGGNTVSVISTASLTVLTTITIGTLVADVAVTGDGTRAFVIRNSANMNVVVVDVSFGAPLLTVDAGGTITSSTADALIQFASSTVAIGAELVRLTGRTTATAIEVADGVSLTLGTDQPVSTNGPLIESVGATVSAQKAVVIDTALLAATAPLLNVTAQSTFSTAFEAIDLLQRVKLTSVGPLVKLDASTLTVGGGALVRVGGGSLLRVTGDLVQLANGSTLNLSNGPLLSASGGSVVNVSGALIAFAGSGGNAVNVTNTLCAGTCPSFNGVPVFLTGGATSSQVSIGPSAIKNPSLGSITPSGGSTALIAVNGPTTKVTIGGQ